jgi:hypothetical protein
MIKLFPHDINHQVEVGLVLKIILKALFWVAKSDTVPLAGEGHPCWSWLPLHLALDFGSQLYIYSIVEIFFF